MKMIICDPDIKESHLIGVYVQDYYRDKGIDIHIRYCGNWQELCSHIRQREADIIIVSQNGVIGLDIVSGLKAPAGKVIWFSDLDFGVQAYRLHVSYFNMLPITQEKIIRALQHVK